MVTLPVSASVFDENFTPPTVTFFSHKLINLYGAAASTLIGVNIVDKIKEINKIIEIFLLKLLILHNTHFKLSFV